MLSIIKVPPVPEHHALTLTRDEFAELSVVDQLRRAFSPGHRLGALIGTLVGSFVPLASYVLIHGEAALKSWLVVLVLGSLIFSALSVYQWAAAAFQSGLKAAGFCVLVEGTMALSRTEWLGLTALGLLVIVNVISCAVALQVGPDGASDAAVQSLGLTSPSVTVNVANVQQNAITPAPRQSTGRQSRTDAERKAADAKRAREYRERKKHNAVASQTA